MFNFIRRWLDKLAEAKETYRKYKAAETLVAHYRKFCEDNQTTCTMTSRSGDVGYFSWITGPFRIEQRVFEGAGFTVIEVFHQNLGNKILDYTYYDRKSPLTDKWCVNGGFDQNSITMMILSGEEYEMGGYEKWLYSID